jgi:hypothetical protein
MILTKEKFCELINNLDGYNNISDPRQLSYCDITGEQVYTICKGILKQFDQDGIQQRQEQDEIKSFMFTIDKNIIQKGNKTHWKHFLEVKMNKDKALKIISDISNQLRYDKGIEISFAGYLDKIE